MLTIVPSMQRNQGMEDLFKLNEIASTTKTEMIPPRSNKTIWTHTGLISWDLR